MPNGEKLPKAAGHQTLESAILHLRLEKRADCIARMLPNDLDLSGWEFAKTLRLFATCTLALNEWLDRPIIYWEPNEFRNELLSLVPAYFNPRKSMHHYLSMAKRTAEENLDGRRITIMKLFYIPRPSRPWTLSHKKAARAMYGSDCSQVW